MRVIDHDGLVVCRIQGELFETSLEVCRCSSPIFIRRFMNSRVARRMDRESFLNGSDSVNSIFREIDEQYGPSNYGKVKYDADELYWMGYLYRYWAYVRTDSSAQIYRIMPAKELASLFLPYHSLDPGQAIERILEAKGAPNKGDLTERGVQALRKIRSESHFDYAFVNLTSEEE